MRKGKRVLKVKLLLAFSLLLLSCTGRGKIDNVIEQRRIKATREAEMYPWLVNPISEESKTTLCKALERSPDDRICQAGTRIIHSYVFEKVQEVFPAGQTSYVEVEAKLGDFPHYLEETKRPDGTLVGMRYVYRLTEYEGACIYFYVNAGDKITIERIGATNLGSGYIPTTCGPGE